jgi:hypothetical protein
VLSDSPFLGDGHREVRAYNESWLLERHGYRAPVEAARLRQAAGMIVLFHQGVR